MRESSGLIILLINKFGPLFFGPKHYKWFSINSLSFFSIFKVFLIYSNSSKNYLASPLFSYSNFLNNFELFSNQIANSKGNPIALTLADIF